MQGPVAEQHLLLAGSVEVFFDVRLKRIAAKRSVLWREAEIHRNSSPGGGAQHREIGNIVPTDELALDFWTDLSLRESRAPQDRGPWFFAKSRVGILAAPSSINPGYQTGRLLSVSGVLRKA